MNPLNSLIIEGNVIRNERKKGNFNSFDIAVNRSYINAEGKEENEISYFQIEAFGGLAEASRKWAETGRGVRIVGRLKQLKYTEDGRQKSSIVIIAEHLEFKPFKRIGGTEEND